MGIAQGAMAYLGGVVNQPLHAAAPSARTGKWIKNALGISLTLFCLAIIVRKVDFAQAIDALDHFRWPFLLLGLLSLAIDYSLRIYRWNMMLRATGASVRFRTCVAPFLGAIALNNVLPLRLGDVVRAFVFPQAMGLTRTTALTSLVLERLIDLITLLACLSLGLLSIQTVNIPVSVKDSAIVLSLISGVLLIGGILLSGKLSIWGRQLAGHFSERQKVGRFFGLSADFLDNFKQMSRLRILLPMILISMIIWIGEAGLFYSGLLGLGFNPEPTAALLVMSLATLATLAPSSPGYVGPFHLAAFTAISLVGGTDAEAGAYAVLVHLALWLSTTVVGALALWAHPQMFRLARQQSQSTPEIAG